MTAYSPPPKDTITGLYRRHLREMRTYADELARVLGETSPIVVRIRHCATSNEYALDAIVERYKRDGPNFDWAYRENACPSS